EGSQAARPTHRDQTLELEVLRALGLLAWSPCATAGALLDFATGRPPVPHTGEKTLSGLFTASVARWSSGKVSSVCGANSAFQPLVTKPCSSKLAARTLRSRPVASPSTTAISLWPPRVALATILKPLSQMKPVFIPSAPA